MADMFSPEKRSEIMSRIRSKNTAPEKLLFSIIKPLYNEGFRYCKHYSKVPGKPDLAFTKQKVAVFLDSEFWHGKDFEKRKETLPKKYWIEKIQRNMKRDLEINEKLHDLGWQVIRFWAKDFKKDPKKNLDELETALLKKNRTKK